MKDFTVIMQELIEAIDLTIRVKEVVGSRLYVCKTLFLTDKYTVKDTLGNEYRVTGWMNNEWIEVAPLGGSPDPFNDYAIVCPQITYLHGTPMTVNQEFAQLPGQVPDRMPLIWLNENYKEETPGRGSSVEREVTPDLFFIDEMSAQWTNADHHRRAIQPMANLIQAWVEAVKANRKFKSIETSARTPRSRFGVYFENQGNKKKVIDAPLSAVQMQPTLVKYKEACNCF